MTKKIEEVRHLGEKKRPIAEQERETYDRDYSRYAFSYPTDKYKYVLKPGLSREVVEEISAIKNEPKWMREFRLQAYEIFLKKPMPTWGGDLSQINFDTITYYATPSDKSARSWEDVPEEVKKTFDRLGIPEAERKFLAGVGAQYDSEVLYHSIREDLAKKGVIFLSMDDGLREYPDLVKEYIGTVIPPTDNKFAALNSAVWSGGCLTAEARVFTRNGGIKSIAEVRPGDIVSALSSKGELVPAKVIAHIHSGRKPVYRFRVAGRTLEATANHLFLTLEKSPTPLNRFGRKWRMVWKPLAELHVGDVIAIAKRLPWQGHTKPLPPLPPYRKNHHLQRSLRAPAQTNSDLMWLLGVWMGDGNIYAPHPHMRFINFALPERDPARAEAIRLLHKLFNYSVKTQTPRSFTVHSKALGEWLEQVGFVGKAKTKRIPPWVFGLPVEERLAFLGGLLDSDGWVENNGKIVCFELANKKLIEDIKLLAISCGLFSDGKIRERDRGSAFLKREKRQIVSGTTYVCRITGDVALIGSRNPRWRALLDSAQKRTFDKYTTVTGENFSSLATADIGFAPIREKEYIGVRDVYDIQVEDHANFVANGIIAHNSFIYVPKGVQVDIPLQAYFRINAPQMGQFERTLIIADEGARVHYIEGCLPGGEQVSIGDRWVNIESLKPGDYVVADNGQKARVRAVMVRPYRGEMLTITPISPYNAFKLTPEHPVLVVRRKDVLTKRRARNGWLPEVDTEKLLAAQPKYVPAGELTIGDFLVFPKVQAERHNPKYTPEVLKLLGYYLAEGSAFVNRALNMPVVSFSFGAHERDTIGEVCQLIESVTGKRPCVTELPEKHAVTVSVYSQELMDLCIEACGKGAATKRLSAELMALPAEQMKPFLEAYFRGDSNVCDKGNSVMYRAATASETLAHQIQELLARQGIYASIQVRRGGEDTIQGRTIHRHDQYIVVYAADKCWSEIRQTERYFLVPIKEIARAPYEGFVFNLDVEGPNSYLVRGFAVHNCTAPVYSKESLHSAVVELIAKRGAHLRYTTLQNWSNDVYNLVTKRAVAYEDATVEWVDANIGCLTADTKVFLNPRGAVNITEIKPGDWVYALDLNAMEIVKRPVKGVVCTGVRPVFKLTTENHREIKATANHPFLALQRTGKHWQLVWKPLEHLQVGEYIALSQGLPDEGKPYRIEYQSHLKRVKVKPRLPRETTEELMWLVGLYLGDGFIERGTNGVPRRVYFAVPESDPARLKLTKLLQKLFAVGWKPKGISVTVNSAIFAEFLLSLGLAGTAKEKRIPRWVFRLPVRHKLALIEGYLDADGHIRQHHGKDGKLYGQLTFASCNRELLEDLKLLMISCGLNPLKISSYSRERVLLGQYRGTYTTHYLNLPFSDLEVIRAKSAPRPSVEFVRVLSIESLGEEPVYDIEVAGAHNFIANGLVVHNSRLTMKYPSVYMLGKGARADILSVAFAGKGQHQDTGGKAIHAAPYTTSTIVSKSVSKDGGRATYRGHLVVAKGAHHAKSNVRCDALILDERSRSDTYPYIEIDEDQVTIGHEATVGKVGDDQIFYLMSRGLSESEALSMIVLGFMEPFTKTLPMEYAIEFNRLIQLEMEGSVG
uniref:DOD-type homing endonuclease domain-containing protein n=1 Tax=uncultured Acetothermia bacterium TaxID=236499 RepID=H5SLQ1_9BACT|nr:hypothetical protein HGMM_F47C08C08 [uncultured Acetothermia bacterium]